MVWTESRTRILLGARSPKLCICHSFLTKPLHGVDLQHATSVSLGNIYHFRSEIIASGLGTTMIQISFIIITILEQLLPISRAERPSDPWFSIECREDKRTTCRLECAAANAIGQKADNAGLTRRRATMF